MAEIARSAEVDLPSSKERRKFPLQRCHAQMTDSVIWLKLHEQVYIAGFSKAISQHGSEESQPPNAGPAAKGCQLFLWNADVADAHDHIMAQLLFVGKARTLTR